MSSVRFGLYLCDMATKPDGLTLYDLYAVKRLTQKEIALLYEVSRTGARNWLLEAGISLDRPLVTKGRKKSPEHAAKLAENLKKARANAFTPEARAKQARAMLGKTPHNKGKKWTETERAAHSYRQTPEYREKLAEAHRGEKNGQWKGGIRSDPERLKHWSWKQARALCYERDNWTCQECGVKCRNKVRIQAHHIVPRRHGGGDELENLVTLCASCHRSVEWKATKP